jgi:hypothetical protein
MKAVLIATDYIKTSTGEYKVLEINTNTRIVANVDELDWSELTTFIQTNSFTNVHCIIPHYDKGFSTKLSEICDTIGGITFLSHETSDSSITVPYIEDNESTLILRVSYDTTAIIDDGYCRDKYALLRSIETDTSKPKTYIPNVSDDFDTMEDFTYTDDLPNFIIKKRYPNYDKNDFPKLYKIENLTELNSLKTTVNEDTEFLQEFTQSEIISNKRSILRGISIIYGSNLDIINMGGYKVLHAITETIWTNAFDETTGLLAKKDRPKYITYYSNTSDRASYIYDEEQEVLMADGTRKQFSELEVDDMVKSIDVASLPLDETEYKVEEWTGSHTDFIANFAVGETAIVVKTSKSTSDLFIRITLEDGTEWDDLPATEILVKNDDVIRFKRVNNLQIGDVLELFSTETETIVNKTITNLEILFKEDTVVGTMDVEPKDLFLPLITNSFAIVQHNACNVNFCSGFGNSCYNYGKCGNCSYYQCAK